MHALDPLPTQLKRHHAPHGPVPRVLVSAPEIGRSGLLEQLRQQGLAILIAPTDGLLRVLNRGDVDLLLLLSTDGNVALRQLHMVREVSDVPVVVMLLQGQPSAEECFNAGADEVLMAGTSEFDVGLHVRAMLRRRQMPEPNLVLVAGRFRLDLARHVFTADDRPIHLPPKEFGLLALLLRRDGKVVSREDALDLVWGSGHSGDPTTVDVHVKRLRAKLEVDPARPLHLITVRGLGYRFQT